MLFWNLNKQQVADFYAIRAWRNLEAEGLNVPAYRVMPDRRIVDCVKVGDISAAAWMYLAEKKGVTCKHQTYKSSTR